MTARAEGAGRAQKVGPTVPGELLVKVEHDTEASVLVLYGELDIASAPRLDQALIEAESRERRIVVDLSGLQFMDSAGLHALLGANERCSRNGCSLSLLRGPRQVHRVFELTQADRVFTFED